MKKQFILCTVLLIILGTFNAQAKSKPSPPPVPQHAIVIASISSTSITVKTEKLVNNKIEQVTKTYTILSTTGINFNGKPVPITNLQPGMRVSVSEASTPGVAALINASEPPKPRK